MKKVLIVLSLGLLLGFPMGCKKVTATTPTLATGAYNSTDQAIYQSLMAAQAALNLLKTEVPANPSLKAPVNQAIVDYNLAEVAWQTYHSALATNPKASPTAAQAAVAKVQTDLSAATKAVN